MTLRELLTELRSTLLRDTSTAVEGGAEGQLWADASLVMYIRDAEEKFAAGTMCLRDASTAAVTQVTLVAGQADYPLDPTVLAVQRAACGAVQLGRTSVASMLGATSDLHPGTPTTTPTCEGAPLWFYTDRENGSIGVYPVPSATEDGTVVYLQVLRLPLVPLSLNDLDASPEIPREYHLDLLEWAAWRALRNHDADIDGDANNISIVMARSSAHKKRFEEAIAECKRRMKQFNTNHVAFGVRSNWS
jgi:hypothetical protein